MLDHGEGFMAQLQRNPMTFASLSAALGGGQASPSKAEPTAPEDFAAAAPPANGKPAEPNGKT